MSFLWSFCFRLLLCFLAARFILLVFGIEPRGYLVGLTLLFLANVYLLEVLVFRQQFPGRGGRD